MMLKNLQCNETGVLALRFWAFLSRKGENYTCYRAATAHKSQRNVDFEMVLYMFLDNNEYGNDEAICDLR